MKHIILIGFMGAGKTTIGHKLSRYLNMPFVDTDSLIEEHAGQTIPEIFEQHGESYFRRLETEVLTGLKQKQEDCVVSAGGGLPVQPQNHPILKELGTVVYLDADIDTLVQRLTGDKKRPLLQGGNVREKIEALMAEREAVYLETADVVVKTAGKSFVTILEEISVSVKQHWQD